MISLVDSIGIAIEKNLKKLFVVISFIVGLEVVVGVGIMMGYINYIERQMNNNILEYNEVDIQQLCNISDCVEVISGAGKIFAKNKNGILIKTKSHHHNILYKTNNILIDTELNIFIYNETANAQFLIKFDDIRFILVKSFYLLTPLLFLFFIIILLLSIRDERSRSIKDIMGAEAILTNQSMILITENIHHELNSPLEVIDSKMFKLKKIFDEYNSQIKGQGSRAIDSKILSLQKDFEMISQSSDQIYNILEKMKGFKNIRYSNGNKTIWDIIDGSFRVISISNSNFEFDIDCELKKFSLNSKLLKNADILNIIINHIKNSLDANANKIHIVFHNSNNNMVCLDIIDNGNGINMENKKDIFKANFSTKRIGDSDIRGNGLYLNKFILNSSGGSVNLINTNKFGTNFRICIPCMEHKSINI